MSSHAYIATARLLVRSQEITTNHRLSSGDIRLHTRLLKGKGASVKDYKEYLCPQLFIARLNYALPVS